VAGARDRRKPALNIRNDDWLLGAIHQQHRPVSQTADSAEIAQVQNSLLSSSNTHTDGTDRWKRLTRREIR
jgi:hypothetical protein